MRAYFSIFAMVLFILALFSPQITAKPVPLNKLIRCGLCYKAVSLMEEKIAKIEMEKKNIKIDVKFRLDERRNNELKKQVSIARAEQTLYDIIDETKLFLMDKSRVGILNTTKILTIDETSIDDRLIVNTTNTKAIKYALSELLEYDEDILNILKQSTEKDSSLKHICHSLTQWCSKDEFPADFGECNDEFPVKKEDKTDEDTKSGDMDVEVVPGLENFEPTDEYHLKYNQTKGDDEKTEEIVPDLEDTSVVSTKDEL